MYVHVQQGRFYHSTIYDLYTTLWGIKPIHVFSSPVTMHMYTLFSYSSVELMIY